MNLIARRTKTAILGLLLAGLTLSYTATAGVYTTLDSATESDYIGFQVSTLVARVHSDDPDANTVLGHFLKKEFKKRGVTVYLHDDIFPATQPWDDETMHRAYESLGIDGVMLVQRVAEVGVESSNRPSGQRGRVRYYSTSRPPRSDQPSGHPGTGPIVAFGSGRSPSSQGGPMPSQTAQYQVEVVDWTQGREVWRSNIETRVTSDHGRYQQQRAKGTALGIIRGLTESEHVLATEPDT